MARKFIFFVLFSLSVLVCLPARGQAAKPISVKKTLIGITDSILKSQVDLNKIPGAVIEIKEGKKILVKRAYGRAGKDEKMTTKHLFDIASLTKVVGTTTSVMLLADKGLLNVDDPVFKYIKAFESPDKRTITIRHLLTHTAGLIEWYPLYYLSSEKTETYKLIGELPLKYAVGEKRSYSDLGFVLLGEIIEIVSGMPLDQFMKQNIFEPLKMKKTTYNPCASGRFKKIASTSEGNPYEKRMVYDSTLGYSFPEINPASWNGWRTYTLRGEVNDGNAWYSCNGISGAAGLFSTADDIQKIVDMLINKGRTASGQFISEKTIETFLTKDAFNNGLGWMMDPANSFMRNGPEGSFGHTGFTGTSISVIPQDKISVVLLINRQNTGLLDNQEYYNVNPVRLQIYNAVLKYLR
ncbi:MAG: beta-lactamase family protein [Bacteroidales bacterium]|nr:beta-lactamase family protein [Bacteroidales bacterium]